MINSRAVGLQAQGMGHRIAKPEKRGSTNCPSFFKKTQIKLNYMTDRKQYLQDYYRRKYQVKGEEMKAYAKEYYLANKEKLKEKRISKRVINYKIICTFNNEAKQFRSIHAAAKYYDLKYFEIIKEKLPFIYAGIKFEPNDTTRPPRQTT